eukprot:UN05294
MFQRIINLYKVSYNRFPLLNASLTAGLLAFGSEYLTQKYGEKRTKIDKYRMVSFLAFQSVYCGLICHGYFNVLYPYLFRGSSQIRFGIYSALIDR